MSNDLKTSRSKLTRLLPLAAILFILPTLGGLLSNAVVNDSSADTPQAATAVPKTHPETISKAARKAAATASTTGERVSLMSFNAENLFDEKKDADRDDDTFLPLAAKQSAEHKARCARISKKNQRDDCLFLDWNANVVAKKLQNVANVVLQVSSPSNAMKGPDILILVEVENKNILERLRKEYLREVDYHTNVLLEGPDTRGIDLALLSRFPINGEPKLHIVPFKTKSEEDAKIAKRTRGILETRLVLPDGQNVAVFAVHFPAAYNPSYLRTQAIEHLALLQKNLPPGVLAIAAGDFNITSAEDREIGPFSKRLAQNWTVSHLIGCKGCSGSHYFHPKREWSFLDAILFGPGLEPRTTPEGWRVDPASIRLANQAPGQKNKYGNPMPFNEKTGEGVSDHWPVVAELYKPKAANGH